MEQVESVDVHSGAQYSSPFREATERSTVFGQDRPNPQVEGLFTMVRKVLVRLWGLG